MARLKTATRTIINAGIRRVIGQLYSYKNSCMAVWESQIERDFYYYCEYSPDVISYVPQPEEIPLFIDGAECSYTPDTRVIYRDDVHQYVEVKPDKYADEADAKLRFAAAAECYMQRNCQFTVIRESFLRRGYQMDNIRLLYRYARWPITPGQIAYLLDRLADQAMPLGDICDEARDAGISLGVVYRLMFDQKISGDLVSQRVGPLMEIRRNKV